MSVRVVARIRPLLNAEAEKDQILSIHDGSNGQSQIVKIPNPKNFSEEYSFVFASVFSQEASQQELFDAEVAPTLRHLFQGFDVTLFAYGVTGSGKTHTMRGGKSLTDRGMIPRMLSNIYRKSRALEKAGNGDTTVDVSMSYYEIYNDKVFDLFEPPEKRTPTGLPIREAEGGKTVIAGLTEVPCSTLKEFEHLYDKANSNRSVGATKLNAQSSRSHAILCVKVTINTSAETRTSTISAIDLAGSEDNRRTGNVKERMVESASINKSLFVLAQCVEAISKKQSRIPYRESKMTRILSLGQNNGLTVMILNLPPTKAFHLDTLSSLNFANRTKKIEVREIENEPIFKGPPRPALNSANNGVTRQPLRPLNNATNANILANREAKAETKDKPAKLFSVYADKSKCTTTKPPPHKSSPLKRMASDMPSARPYKQPRPISGTSFLHRGPPEHTTKITTATLESLVEKKVAEILAQRAQNESQPALVPQQEQTEREKAVSAEVQARLDSIEKRLEGQEGEKAEGLSYLFMAKQHQARGEASSALRMYELAQPFFPGNEKLERKIEKLRAKLIAKKRSNVTKSSVEQINETDASTYRETTGRHGPRQRHSSHNEADEADDSYHIHEDSYHDGNESEAAYSDDSSPHPRRRRPKPKTKKAKSHRTVHSASPDPLLEQRDRSGDHVRHDMEMVSSPRTQYLIDTLNTRSISKLKALNGLGIKKAEAIVEHLTEHDVELEHWRDVLGLDVKGIGNRSWETVREGVLV